MSTTGAVRATYSALLGTDDVGEQRAILVGIADRYRAVIGPQVDELEDLARTAAEKLDSMEPLTPEEHQALEQAVRLLRPIKQVVDGAVDDLHPSEHTLFEDWMKFQGDARDLVRRVARLDGKLVGEEQRKPVATAFAISDSLVVTNRHVVAQLSLTVGELAPGQVTIHFGQESDLSVLIRPCEVTEVRAIHPELDLAVLAYEPNTGSPDSGLALGSGAPDPFEPVVVVGFPQPDPRNPGFTQTYLQRGITDKRAAPGVIRELTPAGFQHDATTLGGNSGSPVLRLSDRRVIGVHNGGAYLSSNEAQGANQAEEFLVANGAQVA